MQKLFITAMIIAASQFVSASAKCDSSATGMKSVNHIEKSMQQDKGKMMRMLGTKDAEYDLRFTTMMIQHHQGAIDMAQNTLNNAQHAELKEFAQKVIDAQSKEIEQLKAWRKQWYGP